MPSSAAAVPAPEVYAIVVQCMPGARFKCKLLSRPGFPNCVCELSSTQKMKIAVQVGDILQVDPTDYDRNEQGTGEILEVIHNAKDLKRLRKDGLIPEVDAMPQIVTKEHHTTKRDKQHAVKRSTAESELTAEEEIEERNRQLSQPPAPTFDDESDAVPEEMQGHPAMQDSEDEATLADKRDRGDRLSKAEKQALKLEEKARAAHDQLECNLANGVSGEALDDL